MKKTAALNKLALAVRNYVQSEQQFNKIAATLQQYQHQGMQKEAQGILQRLGLSAPPPAAKSNMGRNAALAALLLGGGAAGAHAAGLFDEGRQPGKRIADAIHHDFDGILGPKADRYSGGEAAPGIDLSNLWDSPMLQRYFSSFMDDSATAQLGDRALFGNKMYETVLRNNRRL